MPRLSSRAVRVLVLSLLSSTVVLSACSSSSSGTSGEASKSASKIFSDARKATESASSVHISGQVTSGKDKIVLDLVDASARSGGTISDNGSSFQIVLSGKTIYLKASAATMSKLAGNKAAGQLLGGKWLKTSKDNKDFGSLAELFNLSKLIQGIQPKGTLHKGSVTTIAGQSAIALTDTSRKGTLYVATNGAPYMIELVGGKGEPGTIKFDQYRSAKAPAIPTGAINLDQLESGSAS